MVQQMICKDVVVAGLAARALNLWVFDPISIGLHDLGFP